MNEKRCIKNRDPNTCYLATQFANNWERENNNPCYLCQYSTVKKMNRKDYDFVLLIVAIANFLIGFFCRGCQ